MYNALSDCLVADPEAVDFKIQRTVTELHPGDLLILCSDGVHEVLGDIAWQELMREAKTPLELAQRTCKEVLQADAPDNFSIAVAAVVPPRCVEEPSNQ